MKLTWRQVVTYGLIAGLRIDEMQSLIAGLQIDEMQSMAPGLVLDLFSYRRMYDDEQHRIQRKKEEIYD